MTSLEEFIRLRKEVGNFEGVDVCKFVTDLKEELKNKEGKAREDRKLESKAQ